MKLNTKQERHKVTYKTKEINKVTYKTRNISTAYNARKI